MIEQNLFETGPEDSSNAWMQCGNCKRNVHIDHWWLNLDWHAEDVPCPKNELCCGYCGHDQPAEFRYEEMQIKEDVEIQKLHDKSVKFRQKRDRLIRDRGLRC